MKSVNLCLATHNHQPIGNFDHIIEEAYQHSYRPFFELAHKKAVRFATHFTGILLDWISAKHPEHTVILRSMVASDQLEIISGGFYEPILSVIPPKDQQAQIALLSERIRSLYGYEPTGMWLAERVWEQPLAAVLHEAGMKYVLLDNTHFLYAGLAESELAGYYLTEDCGKTLAVLPISKALRYTIPFAPVEETLRVLKDAASESGENLLCFADDGEKFGVWPGTFGSVYDEGWLEEFFSKLAENSKWLRMLHPSEAVKTLRPKGRIYLQNASYAEMMQWALPTADANQRYEEFLHELNADKTKWEQYLPFVRGGYWRNFLAKYPETNHLHKHMLRTSARLHACAESGMDVTEARTSLLASQCNDPYWHGVFGGAYLPNLRHANFSALIHADQLLDVAEQRIGVQHEAIDFDCDGADEVILESRSLSIYIKPTLGGMIAEIDYKPKRFNCMNIFSRQREAYHAKIADAGKPVEQGSTAKSIHDLIQTKESRLEDILFYDWYRRGSMIEHFLEPGVAPTDLQTLKFEELGDFVSSPFEWSYSKESNTLSQSRPGTVRDRLGSESQIVLTKALSLNSVENGLKVAYSIQNESHRELRLRFASEWTFNFLAGAAHDRYYSSGGEKLDPPQMNSVGTLSGAGNIRLVDEYLGLWIEVAPQAATEIVRFPIESVSLSESGFERIFQGSVVMPIWDIRLLPDSGWTTVVSVTMENLSA